MKIWQVIGSKKLHILWLVKYCTNAGVSLFLVIYELLQGSKLSSDHKNNIIVQTTSDDIILDY